MYIYALSLNKKKITETKHGTVFFFLPPKQHVFFVYYLVPGYFFCWHVLLFKENIFLL